MTVGELPFRTPSTTTTAMPPMVLTSIAPRLAALCAAARSALVGGAASGGSSVPAGGTRSYGGPDELPGPAAGGRPTIRSNSLLTDAAAEAAISITPEEADAPDDGAAETP